MHINDKILEIVRLNNNTDLSNVNLATLCLYEVLNSPIFNGGFKNINILEKNKTFRIVKGKNIEQDLRNIESEFDSASAEDYYTPEDWKIKLEKDLEEKLENENSDEDYYIDYGFEEDEPENRTLYIQEEVNIAYNRLKDIINSNENYQDLFLEIKNELEKDPLFLIKISTLQLSDRLLLNTLKCFFRLPKEMISNQQYSTDIYFKESEKNIEIGKSINDDSFYMRDVLNAMFLGRRNNHLNQKERLEKIIKSNFDFNEFIRTFDRVGSYKHNKESTIEEKKEIIKEIIKKNKLAKEYFTKDFDYLFIKLFEKKWPNIKERINEEVNEKNYETIESLVKVKYSKDIKEILNKLYKEYPFLLETKINPEKIKFEIIAVKVSDKNQSFNSEKQYEIKSPIEIIPYFEKSEKFISILDVKNPKLEDLNKYEGLNERKNKILLDKFFETNFSINSRGLTEFDGFKLFKKHDNHFHNSDNLFLIRMTYNNMLIGLSKVSQKKDYLYKMETTEIMKPFRGSGLGYEIYDFIAEFISNNNLILYSDHYTENGRVAIPKIKKQLSEKYSNFTYIENDLHLSSIEDLTHSSNLLAIFFPKYSSMQDILAYEKIIEIKEELLKNRNKIIETVEKLIMNNEISEYDIGGTIENLSLDIIKEMDSRKEKKDKVKKPKR